MMPVAIWSLSYVFMGVPQLRQRTNRFAIASIFSNALCGKRGRPALVALILLAFPVVARQAWAQAPAPVFGVARIKLSAANAQTSSFRVTGRRFEAKNATLNDLICFAYEVHPSQIIGIPGWGDVSRFDFAGWSDEDVPSNEAIWREMLQRDLAAQFRLGFHREMQEASVYALTVSPGVQRLAPSQSGPNGLPGFAVTLGALNAAYTNQGSLSATNASMKDFAAIMQRLVLEYPVVDQTGITGRFNFALKWTPSITQFKNVRPTGPELTENGPRFPDLFTAIEEQVGLRLDIQRQPLEVLIIDRVETPFEFDATVAKK
jgi:uncharacterized protein (TIGR03435 family)